MTSSPAELVARAREAGERAYAPYSKFRVGAAVLAADGRVFTGANVENSAYGSTLCAEAVAIGGAVAAGATELDAVAAVCLDGHGCTPCGNCRQLMREFGVARVITEDQDGDVVVRGLEELLPDSFGPESLG